MKKCSFFVLFLMSLLAGCAGVPVSAPPQIVKTVQIQYQPVPAALLTPCLIPVGVPATNSDLLILQQATLADLMACNQQILRIKNLKPPDATSRP